MTSNKGQPKTWGPTKTIFGIGQQVEGKTALVVDTKTYLDCKGRKGCFGVNIDDDICCGFG